MRPGSWRHPQAVARLGQLEAKVRQMAGEQKPPEFLVTRAGEK